jgi:hypothetical protein
VQVELGVKVTMKVASCSNWSERGFASNTGLRGVGLGVRVAVGLTVGVAVRVCVGVAVRAAVGGVVGFAVGGVVGFAVGAMVGLGVGVPVGPTVGVGVTVAAPGIAVVPGEPAFAVLRLVDDGLADGDPSPISPPSAIDGVGVVAWVADRPDGAGVIAVVAHVPPMIRARRR